jgi:hypothetical protein
MLSRDQTKYLVWKNSATAKAENDNTQNSKIDDVYAFLEQSRIIMPSFLLGVQKSHLRFNLKPEAT